MASRKVLSIAGGLTAAVLLVPGCGGGSPKGSPSSPGPSSSAAPAATAPASLLAAVRSDGGASFDSLYVGTLSGTAAYLAVGLKGGQAVAYVCDGATVGEWLQGSSSGPEVSASGGGGTLSASVQGSRLAGQLSGLAGASGSFDLAVADGDDALIGAGGSPSPINVGLVIFDGQPRGMASFVTTGGSTGAGTNSPRAFRKGSDGPLIGSPGSSESSDASDRSGASGSAGVCDALDAARKRLLGQVERARQTIKKKVRTFTGHPFRDGSGSISSDSTDGSDAQAGDSGDPGSSSTGEATGAGSTKSGSADAKIDVLISQALDNLVAAINARVDQARSDAGCQ